MRDESEEPLLATLSESRLRELLSIYGEPSHWDKRTIPAALLIKSHEVSALCRYMLDRLSTEQLAKLRGNKR